MTQINGIYPGQLYPDHAVAGCISIFENVLPNTEDIIASVENECENQESFLSWSKATIFSGDTFAISNYRTNSVLDISSFAENGNGLMQNIHNQMYLLLLASTIPYAELYDIPSMYHEGYQMIKYNSGQEYKAHSDGGTATGRAISAVLYLNDDYEGGEIEFVNFGIKIKPKKGMLVLFPSNYAYSHIAHPVTSGTKYAIVTWIHDRPL